MIKKYCGVVCICFLSLCGLLSCGLDAYYYIDFIPEGVYTDTSTSMQLPSSSAEGYSNYFSNFIIFYRIYISNSAMQGGINLRDSATDRIAINSTLNSDFNSFDPLTDVTSTTVSTSNLDLTFSNRKYFTMALESSSGQSLDIDTILGNDSLGRSMTVFFPPTGERPTLTLGGTSYVLLRAVSGPSLVFTPAPNRYFSNHPDLYNSANVTNEINPDVATNSGSDLRYTWVSLYITATGKSGEMPPKTIYSQPTFIGIFRLADSL